MEVYGQIFQEQTASSGTSEQLYTRQQRAPAKLAISVSDELQTKEQAFFAACGENSASALGPFYVDLYRGIVEHSIDFLISQPTKLVDLTKTQHKLANMCASTTLKVTALLSNTVFLKGNNEELKVLGDYWRSSFRKVSPGGVHVTFPLGVTHANDFDNVLEICRTGKTQDNLGIITNTLDSMSVVIIENLVVETLKPVTLGALSNKVVNTGVHSIKKVTRTVLNKLIPNLSTSQINAFVEHFATAYKPRSQ